MLSPGGLLPRTVQLIFFVGLLYILLFALHGYSFLSLRILVVVGSLIGGIELKRIMGMNSAVAAALCAIAIPLGVLLQQYHIIPDITIANMIAIGLLVMLFVAALSKREEKFDTIRSRITNGLFVLCYPGLLGSYFIFISTLPMARVFIVTFIVVVASNDIFAYLFGKLAVLFIRQGNILRPFPISPNKTLAGFIGGLFISGAVVPFILTRFVNPFDSFPAGYCYALAFFTAVAANLGDLAESALKRSVKIKDSGRLIMGRGGILDSIDSFLCAGPIFYWLSSIFYVRVLQ